MKYSVVIPTYNHCDDFLKPCIETIIQYTDLQDVELVISANGCVDNTKQYLEHLKTIVPNLKVVWSDEPLGYPKATNLGIKAATADKIVLLNNDTKFLPQEKNTWLNLLNAPFEDEKCGITCVVKEYSRVMQKSFAVFFCVMIHRKVFDRIGLLNEEYGTGSGEDMEFCIQTELAGFEVVEVIRKVALDRKYFTGSFPIYHFGEGTVHDTSLVPDWKEVFLRNGLRLANKYNEEWKVEKNMNHPRIGVITPVYNDIEHIFHAISSVKSQKLGNVKHFIYDDCSTDGLEGGLKEILRDDPSIVFIRGTENKGQSHARNKAIAEAFAHGCDYIAFLDSDDFWYPNHLQRALENLRTKNCNVTYSTPQFVTEDGNVVFPMNIPVPHVFVGKQLRHNNFIWISSVVCNARCLLGEEFDSNLNSIEDWDMWLRMHNNGHIFYKDSEMTVRYLVRDGSQAHRGGAKMPLFWQKHQQLPQLKLHLACGHDYNEDYINIDLYAPEDAKCDVRFDVAKLPYDDNTVDEIKAFHIIEHFHFFEIQEVLKEWYRVLKPGGKLYLETPDFLETCRSFVEGNPATGMDIEQWRILLYGHFFAHAWVPGQTHKFLFTETQLRTNLGWAGFKDVVRVRPASKYVMNETYHLFLTVEAFK
jgi:glycosyltransferase involved in cell wall biosynthesis